MLVQAQTTPPFDKVPVTTLKAMDAPPQGRTIHLNTAPEQLGGGGIHYASSTTDYILRFAANGTYEEVWVHRNGTQPGHKTGTYSYTKTGPDTANLTIDTIHYGLTVGLSGRMAVVTLQSSAQPQNWYWEPVI